MAISSASLRQQYSSRSISLPSRLHPKAIRIGTELNKLKALEISATPLSGEAIQTGLVGLAELYNCVQELIQSSTTQQALLQHQHGIIVEEALEESVELLDSCGYVRDLLSMMKQQVQMLQSAMRRKSGDHSNMESDINSFLCFRKKINKDVSKSLRKLKIMESRAGHDSPLLDIDHYLSMVIRVVREVTSMTISVLRSLLFFLSWPASKTKPGGWSLISKLMLAKSAAAERAHVMSEMGSVDIALRSLRAHFRNNDAKVVVQMAQKRLHILDSTITSLDAGIECWFRQLVQNRVSLLNILTS